MRPLPDDPLAVPVWLDELAASGELPPELVACQRTPQPEDRHAEGDVYRHTRLAVASLPAAAAWLGIAPTLQQAAAVMCHDIGKAPCWDPDAGTFYGHDVVGAEMTPAFLDRIDPAGRIDRERAAWCVREHLFWLHADIALVRDAPVLRRYGRNDGWSTDLRVVNICDGLATLKPGGQPNRAHIEACQAKVDEVLDRAGAATSRPQPVLSGHDVMEALGLEPGPAVGAWLRQVAATGIRDRQEARAWLLSARGGSHDL